MERPSRKPQQPHKPGWIHWTIVAFLFAFSVLAMASIGFYVVLIPIALTVGGLFWERPWIRVGILVGTVAFLVLTTVVMSWSCSSTTAVEASAPSSESQAPVVPDVVECHNMFGMRTYSGLDEPDDGLRFLVLALVGIGIGVGASRIMRKRSEAPS